MIHYTSHAQVIDAHLFLKKYKLIGLHESYKLSLDLHIIRSCYKSQIEVIHVVSEINLNPSASKLLRILQLGLKYDDI